MLKMKNNKHCNKRIGMLVPFVFILCLCFVNKHIHAELNEHDEVVTNYQDTQKEKPDYQFLGNALYEQGNYKEAVDNYEKAIELSLKGFHAYDNLVNALATPVCCHR